MKTINYRYAMTRRQELQFEGETSIELSPEDIKIVEESIEIFGERREYGIEDLPEDVFMKFMDKAKEEVVAGIYERGWEIEEGDWTSLQDWLPEDLKEALSERSNAILTLREFEDDKIGYDPDGNPQPRIDFYYIISDDQEEELYEKECSFWTTVGDIELVNQSILSSENPEDYNVECLPKEVQDLFWSSAFEKARCEMILHNYDKDKYFVKIQQELPKDLVDLLSEEAKEALG